MSRVPLTNSDKFVVIDDKHYETIMQRTWFVVEKVIRSTNSPAIYSLARFILKLEGHNLAKKTVLHKDGDIYNNTVANLVILDLSGRNRNRILSTNRSGYIGVCAKGSRWISQIYFKNTKYYLGSYSTKEEAAKAFNEKLKSLPTPEECKIYNVI